MFWRVLVVVALVLGAFGAVAVPGAQAQARDGCADGGRRGGNAGCIIDVRNFNFVDPGIQQYSAHRLRGRVYIVMEGDPDLVEVSPEGWPAARQTWFPGTGR
jgi:hypothetical protein